MDMVGPYSHPLHVQSSPNSSLLFTMLTMREGNAAASAPKRVEDSGVNDLGDGGAVMRALRHSHPWEVEAGGPACTALVLAAGGRQDWRNTTDYKSSMST